MSLELKHQSWWFPRYWQFNKQYHGGYLLICLIFWPIFITLRCDWHLIKRSFQGLSVAISTMRIIKELMEIWLNEVCDRCHASIIPQTYNDTYTILIIACVHWTILGFPCVCLCHQETQCIVMPQANFLQKITFNTLYTNRFSIRICSRTLSISSEHNTI